MYCGRVNFADTKINTSTTAHRPLWDLLRILESRVKDIDRTSENVSASQMVMIGEEGICKQFCGRNTRVSSRKMVV
jgi:hypothetical protein